MPQLNNSHVITVICQDQRLSKQKDTILNTEQLHAASLSQTTTKNGDEFFFEPIREARTINKLYITVNSFSVYQKLDNTMLFT